MADTTEETTEETTAETTEETTEESTEETTVTEDDTTTEEETTEDDTVEEETEEETTEERVTMIYIGPSIPHSKLRNAQILTGTEASIQAFLEELLERYPEIPYLMVTPENLAEAQIKVRTPGYILNKYYKDTEAKSRVPGKARRN